MINEQIMVRVRAARSAGVDVTDVHAVIVGSNVDETDFFAWQAAAVMDHDHKRRVIPESVVCYGSDWSWRMLCGHHGFSNGSSSFSDAMVDAIKPKMFEECCECAEGCTHSDCT